MTKTLWFRTSSRCCAAGISVFACTLAGSFWFGVHAQQSRTVKDGVYTGEQAQRGAAVYTARCESCHGVALAGDSAPPLAGDGFWSVWDKQPLSDLFDKILNTMPADAPGTLTRPQVADIVAHMLQVSQFPAGRGDLAADQAALKLIAVAPVGPAGNVAPPTTSAQAVSFPPVGNMNQVMRGILFPSSNVIFDVQTQDPGAQPKPSARADATTTTGRYGNVYDGWLLVDVAAVSLAESGPLLMMPGRRCENGKPVPVERADWLKYVQELVDAGRAAYRASQSRNQEAVSRVTDQISDACANCHRVYRDTANAALRCTPQ